MPVFIEWMFNGIPISQLIEMEKISVADVGRRSKALSIESVDARYAGNYTCKASNIADSVYHSAELIVNGKAALHSSYIFLFQSLPKSLLSRLEMSRWTTETPLWFTVV